MLTFTEHLYIRFYYSPEEAALVNMTPFATGLLTAAGLLANLILYNRVRLEPDRLLILDPNTTQDDLLDEALARLASIGSIDHNDPEWFGRIADALPLGAKLENQITQKGLIYRQEKKGLFGLSKTITYPFHDPAVPLNLFETERAVMLHGARPDPKTAALIFMATSVGAPRPWKLSQKEHRKYDDRYTALYGTYWGWYDKNEPVEPIDGLTADTRHALADLTISWATIYVA